MTAQEVFTTVATHLLTQRAKSKRDDGTGGCLYRNSAGLTCAVGCLIPNEVYTPAIEGSILATVISIGKRGHYSPAMQSLVIDVLEPNEELLGDLQFVHDLFPVDDWPAHLAHIAEKNGWPVPA